MKSEDKRHERQTKEDDIRRGMGASAGSARPKDAGSSGDEPARDRVDEASEESFPASDPPQQP